MTNVTASSLYLGYTDLNRAAAASPIRCAIIILSFSGGHKKKQPGYTLATSRWERNAELLLLQKCRLLVSLPKTDLRSGLMAKRAIHHPRMNYFTRRSSRPEG
jgi:hypothetical protein